MTIDLVNILDRFLPLKTLEMAFQSMKISKFSGKANPQTPPPCPSGSSVIKKKIRFYVLTKLDSLSFFVNMVSSRNLDYIFYSAFNSSKGKKYVR